MVLTPGARNLSLVLGFGGYNYKGNGGLAVLANMTYAQGLAVDAAGNVFVAEQAIIRRVDVVSGIVTIVAGSLELPFTEGGDGLATFVSLVSPNGIAFDARGAMIITTWGGNIRRLNLTTGGVMRIGGQLFPCCISGAAVTGDSVFFFGPGAATNFFSHTEQDRHPITASYCYPQSGAHL